MISQMWFRPVSRIWEIASSIAAHVLPRMIIIQDFVTPNLGRRCKVAFNLGKAPRLRAHPHGRHRRQGLDHTLPMVRRYFLS